MAKEYEQFESLKEISTSLSSLSGGLSLRLFAFNEIYTKLQSDSESIKCSNNNAKSIHIYKHYTSCSNGFRFCSI